MKDEMKDDMAVQHEQRRGLLKAMIDHFSSTPITEAADLDLDLEPTKTSCCGVSSTTTTTTTTNANRRSLLTTSERDYLEQLVRNGDMESIEAASLRLSDPTLFPPDLLHERTPERRRSDRIHRDSKLQQHLFRLHETQAMPPSRVLQRMTLVHRNSILDNDEESHGNIMIHSNPISTTRTEEEEESLVTGEDEGTMMDSTSSNNNSEWNPFKDISSWIDGGIGVEVTDSDGVVTKTTHDKAPFKILGTAADDVSCHPHVLSPPLMESLLAFLPESLVDLNFWLKYSLQRDGASFWTMLRNIRASHNCFLAIETVDGHVFGAFTSQSWRLSQGWYGTKDSFLWKMRHSRLEHVPSILQQVSNESEIQVYPYRPGNVALQHCSKTGIMMGKGELLPATTQGEHYGYALCLDASLQSGSTSTSETFGNPCLVNSEERGSKFEVSNVEVWTLTPHTTVAEAETSELSMLFLEGGEKNLNLMEIIVGGTI